MHNKILRDQANSSEGIGAKIFLELTRAGRYSHVLNSQNGEISLKAGNIEYRLQKGHNFVAGLK